MVERMAVVVERIGEHPDATYRTYQVPRESVTTDEGAVILPTGERIPAERSMVGAWAFKPPEPEAKGLIGRLIDWIEQHPPIS